MDKLSPKITQILKDNQITNLTPIQEQTLPHTLNQKNVIIVSKTGSGKTLSFILPIINELLKDKSNSNDKFAVIIVPTRDLVVQIHNVLMIFKILGLRCASLIDKESTFNDEHIIVSTPGCIRKRIGKFKKIKFLVLDEVDTLFGPNHEVEMKKILRTLGFEQENKENDVQVNHTNDAEKDHNNSKRQKTTRDCVKKPKFQMILSTATFKDSLINEFLDIEIFKKIEIDQKNEQIVQYYALIPFKEKTVFFYEIIRHIAKCIIFVSRVFNTYLIYNFLKELKFNVNFINGKMQQKEKNEIIQQFKNDEFNILICTDILARGIDIPRVEYIVNFDLPKVEKEYVHRIGRTGRKQNHGNSISLFTQYDLEMMQRIEYFTGITLKKYEIDETQMDIYRENIYEAYEKARMQAKLEIKEVEGTFTRENKKSKGKKSRKR